MIGEFTVWLKGYGIEPAFVAPPVAILVIFFLGTHDSHLVGATIAALAFILPFWLPVVLFRYFWTVWIRYIRWLTWFKTEWTVLQIILPPEVEKSPLAMEVVLGRMWQTTGETTFVDRIWLGKCRVVYSLEIACNDGKLGFYIHMRKAWKNTIEAVIYGQFPEAKVVEVPDYAAQVPFNTDEWSLWASEMKYNKVNPYPIKTYVDYQMDKNPDEEYKIDPLTNLLEVFATAKKNEHFWFQVIIRARKSDEWFGIYTKSNNKIKKEFAAELSTIMDGASKRAASVIKGESDSAQRVREQAMGRGLTLLTDGEKRRVESMERKMGKIIFECGLRVLYCGRKENFEPTKEAAAARMFEQTRSEEFNAIRTGRGMNDFDYPWQDFMGIRQGIERRRQFRRYVDRAYFFAPYNQRCLMMSVDELATLWHFPSSSVKTPGLERVASRRAEAPANIPGLPI